MTGEQLYAAHCWAAQRFGYSPRSWEELTGFVQADWDRLAFEQESRDRPEVSYDGPYADRI